MFEGQCYCGRIQFTVTTEPAQLVDCNCTLCRRLGALWAHVPVASVRIDTSNAANVSYAQGDRTLAVQSCSHCGCTTHYETLQDDGEIMAVNFRMCEPQVLENFRIRKFDGADSWRFID